MGDRYWNAEDWGTDDVGPLSRQDALDDLPGREWAAPYTTALSPMEEATFQRWMAANQFTESPGYDMRGYWKGMQTGEVQPPPVGQDHSLVALPKRFVTPFDPLRFSVESQYHPIFGAGDVNTRLYPADMLGNRLPNADELGERNDDRLASPRDGHHRRSDQVLNREVELRLNDVVPRRPDWPEGPHVVEHHATEGTAPRTRSPSHPRGR